MRALTPVEAAIGASLLGCVLAATVPTFVKNLHASRLAEPVDGLNRIAGRATLLAAGRRAEHAYPETVGLTPEEVPRGGRVEDPPDTWNHKTWRALAFEISVPHSFSFAFDSENQPGEARFVARAHGDLDGDGQLSTFSISGSSKDGGEPVVNPLEVDREVD
jgi:hypothetical protein